MSIDTVRLLKEYMQMAYDYRESWDCREGDEADFKVRYWQRKIDEIKSVLANEN